MGTYTLNGVDASCLTCITAKKVLIKPLNGKMN
jgi:hypothetical protein